MQRKLFFNCFFKVFKFLFFSILILFCFYFVDQVQAQTFTDDIIFQNITFEDGLSQNTSFCIHQDRIGFMWFGTEDGLNRYNGYKFKVYKKDLKDPASISVNYILSMYEDREGILWIGTRGGGLNRYDRNKENFIRYMNIPDNKNSLSHNWVNIIRGDTSGNIWIGMNGGGLDKLDPGTKRFTHYKYDPENPNSLSSNNVYSVIWDKSGFLWVGTDNGLNKFDPADESFLRYYANSRNPYSLSIDYILYLFQDRAGILWIGTSGGGLNKLVPGDNTGSTPVFISYKNDYKNPASISGDVVTSIFEDKSGVLWIGTYSEGLNKLIPGDNKGSSPTFIHYTHNANDPNSIANNSIFSIYEDRSGVLWIGTKGGGISKYDREKKNFFLIRNKPNDKNSISHNQVRVISEDRSGNLWIGTDGGGLDCYNRETGTYTHYRNNPGNPNSLSHNLVRSIHQDRKGDLWIGTDGGGVNKLDIKTGIFTRYKHNPQDPYSLGHNTIRPILEDHQGLLWIGTFGAGLNLFDRQKNRFIHYVNDPNNPKSISHNYVYCLYEDRSGVLWIGTDGGGLNRYDREKEIFDRFKFDPDNLNSLSQDNIYSIYEDDSGILWLGTQGGGLNKFDREKQSFIHYNEKDGLPNETIYGILGDNDGNLWLSTNRGISKFDPITEKFKNYDITDGLQSNEFNGGAYFKSKSGAMYFGGINGMNKFFPGEIKDNPNIPPVVITDFQIFNKPVPIGEELNERIILEKSIVETEKMELSYKDRVFSFEFAALNYVAPDKNQYAYMMENFENEWSYIGERKFVSYTNLRPGDYIFRVKASNCDGVWNEEGVSLKITITPPFWLTWWFKSVGISLVVLILFLIYYLRIRQIRRRNIILEKLVKERTKEINEKNIVLKERQQQIEEQTEELEEQTEELIVQRDELYESNSVKDKLFSIIAHDLRSPFNALKGFIEIIQLSYNDYTDEERKNMLGIISESAERVYNLLNNLLNWSRAQRGKIQFNPKMTNIIKLINENIALVTNQAVNKNIEFKFESASEEINLKIDTDLINVVIQNLLTNAIKYTNTNGIIELNCNIKNNSVIVSIKDNGVGISEDNIKKIFERDIHFSTQGTNNETGTGLGLIVCKDFIEKHQGKIWLESEQNKGSAFFISLPVN